MAMSVLTAGRRRRRRWPAVVAVALIGAAGVVALVAWRLAVGDRSAPPAASERAPPPPRTAERRKRPPPLVSGTPLLRHSFRPRLGARTAILVDERTGRVLWAYRPHLRVPVASTTKIMTALLALERLSLRRRVTITPDVPRVALLREGLRAGERVPVWKLLHGLLVYSGNDDALALARAVSGSRPAFVALMNERARQLGLRRTHFSSPSGVVDRDNLSTARDLAALTRVARRDRRFRGIVRTRVARIAWPAPTYGKVYVNKNRLLGSYRGADGVKTGWTTKAGHCLVASAHRRGIRLVAVVLGSPDAFRDARRLLNLGFRRFPPAARLRAGARPPSG